MGTFSTTPVESAPVSGITCKIKKIQTKLVRRIVSRIPRIMAVNLYCLFLHQLVASTRLQVAQTCPVGYILAHILIRRRINELNQSDTSVMEAIGKRF